jgi:aminotransferase
VTSSGSNHIKCERKIIADRISNVSPSGIRKFFELSSSVEDIISLGVGEPDYVTPWYIREAAIQSLENGFTMYTSNQGLIELREAIARQLQERHGLNYDPATQILITVGVSEGLDLALRTVINPDEEVIMPDPCYVAYPASTVLSGGIPVRVPITEKNDFKLLVEDIEQRITKKTKAILFGYPANPTGAVMSKEELTQIAELAKQYNLLVISDEIYERLTYENEHTCVASLPGMQEHTILLNGFSKAFAMTGWRLGYVAASAEIIEAMTRVHQYTMLCAPIAAQYAALEAVKRESDEVDKMVNDYNHRRRFMVNGLREIGLSCFEPKGAFYAFPSISVTGMESEEFVEKLLMEEKVAAVHGSAFGKHGEGYIRCCYATSLQDIEIALERMGRFIKKYRIK